MVFGLAASYKLQALRSSSKREAGGSMLVLFRRSQILATSY